MTIHSVPRVEEQPAHVFDVVAKVRELADRKNRLEKEIADVSARLDAIVQAATGGANRSAKRVEPANDESEARGRGRPPISQENEGGAPRMNKWIAARSEPFRAPDLAQGARVSMNYARTHLCWLITQEKLDRVEPGLYRRRGATT